MRRQPIKRIELLIIASVLVLAPALANLRAPKRVDGFLSGSLKSVLLSEAVSLRSEELRVVFPDFQGKLSEVNGNALFSIRYEIDNAAPGPVTLPVRFLAVDIRDLTARLNGQAVAAEMIADPEEKTECLVRLARHRAAFNPALYRVFFSELRKQAGLIDVPDKEWLSKLEKADLRAVDITGLTPWARKSGKGDDFRIARLGLTLKPGRNTLEVSYHQRMFVDERDYGYFSSWPQKGFTGVDYLLYPAASWPLAKDFRLSIQVEVPDYHHRQLLWTSWHRAIVRCQPELGDASTAKKHLRLLEGSFAGIPSDILTVLVWFGKNAVRHLTP